MTVVINTYIGQIRRMRARMKLPVILVPLTYSPKIQIIKKPLGTKKMST